MSDWHGGWNSDSRRYLAATTTMMVLSTIVFILRLVSRRRLGTYFWWDDYCAGIALLLSYGPNISTVFCTLSSLGMFMSASTEREVAIHHGLGHHAWEVGPANVVKIVEISWVEQITWQLAMPVIKLSLLLFYRRLFPNQWLLRAGQSIGAFVLAWMIATTIVQVKFCTPVAYYWDREIPGGHCLNYEKSHIITGAINVVTDAIVLCLPLPIVWSLNTGINKKIGLSFAFALGGFTCIAGIIRMAFLPQLDPMDISYTTVNIGTWGCVEVSAGVIACNIPAAAPLFLSLIRKYKPKDPGPSEPRGYVFSQNVRDHCKNFGKSRSNKYRYGKNDGISIAGFSTINDYEANEDTVEPIAGGESAPRIAPNFPSNSINVVSQVQQISRPREEKPRDQGPTYNTEGKYMGSG